MKIIYSPGYGGGWASWYDGPREAKIVMLTWEPIIRALEAGEKLVKDKTFHSIFYR